MILKTVFETFMKIIYCRSVFSLQNFLLTDFFPNLSRLFNISIITKPFIKVNFPPIKFINYRAKSGTNHIIEYFPKTTIVIYTLLLFMHTFQYVSKLSRDIVRQRRNQNLQYKVILQNSIYFLQN